MPRKQRAEGTRAPNMTASIYQGNDGRWHGRVTMGTLDNGNPDRRHVSAKTEAEVTQKVRRLEKDREAGRLKRPGKAWTVEHWLTHWLDNVIAPSVRAKTLVGYRTAVRRHLIPGIGQHRINRLQPEHIEKLYALMRKNKLKPATVHQVHRTLRTALNEAVRRGQMIANPVLIAKAPRLVEEEIEPFTLPEAQRVLQTALAQRNGVRFALALTIGLRQGEALGLQWRDVDLRSGTLTIRRAIQRHSWKHGCGGACTGRRGADCPDRHGGGLATVPTKSRSGRRVVGIPSKLLPAFKAHQEAQKQEKEKATNLREEGDWVFAYPNGRPIDARIDHKEWHKLLTKAEVRKARLHDARHTAATMLLVLKVPTRAVMDVMGWSQPAMTTRYQHVPPEVRASIAEQVGSLMWQPEEAQKGATETTTETTRSEDPTD